MFLWWFLVSTGTELFSPKKEVIKKKTEIKAVFTRFRLHLQKHTN